MNATSVFMPGEPLIQQIQRHNLEFDQLLQRALEVSASNPDITPEDRGYPDSYLTLALYRLNTTLTRIVNLDQSRYNLFHDYKLATACPVNEVVPSTKLVRILNKAVELAQPGKTIGVGHYLRAIVPLSLDVNPMPADGFPGQVIHNTFSVETLLWGLGYTAWTSLSDAPEIADLLKALDGREPIEDVQYMMGIENKRLVVRPTSILQPYMLSEGQTITQNLGILAHAKEQYGCVLPSELLELEELINNTSVKESDLQRFLETHLHFFRLWGFCDVYPHVYLTREEEGPLIPDFILVNPALHKATILDLKLPVSKIVLHRPNRNRFAAAIEEAKSQLLEYRDWFEDKHNRLKLKDRLGMEVYRPRLGVIIGSNQEFRDAIERQKLLSRQPDIEVVTYDDILSDAQQRLLLVKSANR